MTGDLPGRIVASGLRSVTIQVVGRVAKLIYDFILSRVLGAAGFGMFAIANSVFDLSRAFAYLGMDHAVVRYVAIADAASDATEVRRVLYWTVAFALGAATITAGVVIYTAEILANRVFGTPELVTGLRLIAIALIPNTILIMVAAAVRARGHASLERTLRFILPPVVLAVLVGGTVLVTRSLTVGLAAFGLSYLICAAVALFMGYRVFGEIPLRRAGPSAATIRRVGSFAAPMFLVSFVYLLLTEASRLVLAGFAGPAEVGVFSVATRLATQLTIFYLGFDALLAPVVAALHARGEREALADVVRTASFWVTALTLPLVLICLATPEVLTGLFGAEFRQGGNVLRLLTFGQFLLVAVGPTGRLLQMSGHAPLDLKNTLGAGVVVIAMSVLLIPSMGAIGAALATVAGIVVLNLLQLIEVRVVLQITPVGSATGRAVAVGILALGLAVLVGRVLAPGVVSVLAIWGISAAAYAVGLCWMMGIRTPHALAEEINAVRQQIVGYREGRDQPQ